MLVPLVVLFLACAVPGLAAAQTTSPGDESSGASTANADAWVDFERARDQRARRTERVAFPLMLGVEAVVGSAFAIGGESPMSGRTRAFFASSGALAAAALFPTSTARGRDARRAWFGVGSTAFSLAFGGGLISLAHDDRPDAPVDARGALPWMGAAAIVQGLALLPIGLIHGLPDEDAYREHATLPRDARIANGARLLDQIDRYEQTITAVTLLSNLLAASVLGAGAVVEQSRRDRRTLGLVSIAPIVSALIMVPRLFVRPRVARMMLGQPAVRLPLNPW